MRWKLRNVQFLELIVNLPQPWSCTVSRLAHVFPRGLLFPLAFGWDESYEMSQPNSRGKRQFIALCWVGSVQHRTLQVYFHDGSCSRCHSDDIKRYVMSSLPIFCFLFFVFLFACDLVTDCPDVVSKMCDLSDGLVVIMSCVKMSPAIVITVRRI